MNKLGKIDEQIDILPTPILPTGKDMQFWATLKRDFMDCRKTDLCWRSTGHSGACEGPSIEPRQQQLGTTLSLLDYERLMILAVKHCPKNHHDWDEVLELTTALDTKQ